MENLLGLLLLSLHLLQGLKPCNAEFNALLGSTIVFELDKFNYDHNEIEWKSKGKTVGHIINGTQVHAPHERSARIFLHDNGNLEIKNLQHKDEGVYVSTIIMKNGTETATEYHLHVYEPVSVSIIKHNQKNEISATFTCNITLECSINNGRNVTFQWNKTRSDMNSILSVHTGNIFQDVLQDNNVTFMYICEARNPVSSGSASFTTSCHNTGTSILWIWFAAIGAVFLVLIVILICCWYYRKKGKNSRHEDLNTYYDTCHSNTTDGIQTTPPEGSISLYATIQDVTSSLKKKNDCITVYATVSSVKTKPAAKAQKSNQPTTVYATVESVKNKRHIKMLQSPASHTIYEEVKVLESQKDMSHYEK